MFHLNNYKIYIQIMELLNQRMLDQANSQLQLHLNQIGFTNEKPLIARLKSSSEFLILFIAQTEI